MGTFYQSHGKRLLDIFMAVGGILLLSPMMAGLCLLVYMNMGSPVFFRQMRPGLGGRPFRVVKFRTMANDSAEDGSELPDHARLERFGAFLRSASFDELPELFTVLKGDMSIVGPRPLLMEYLPLYNQRQARRHRVLPGITGWAQVNGRNAISWEEKFELDNWYVDNVSFWVDMKIIMLSLKKVVGREAINHEGEATMPKFRGTSA